MGNLTSLMTDALILDADVQPREMMSSGLIDDYTQLYAEGHELPPIKVFQDGPDYWVADGFHRTEPEKFAPTFRPERLKAPHFTKLPPIADTQIGWRNVFVCSMADLFGKWVPQEWIDAVLEEVRAAPQWNFLFLTKFPRRLAAIEWPENAWVGTTVDEQYRVKIADRAFRDVKAPVRWLSCEPLRERLTFDSLEMFDWVVIGGQSASTQASTFQPPWAWVEHLMAQARAAKCQVYWKPNLTVRPQEFPGMSGLTDGGLELAL